MNNLLINISLSCLYWYLVTIILYCSQSAWGLVNCANALQHDKVVHWLALHMIHTLMRHNCMLQLWCAYLLVLWKLCIALAFTEIVLIFFYDIHTLYFVLKYSIKHIRIENCMIKCQSLKVPYWDPCCFLLYVNDIANVSQ